MKSWQKMPGIEGAAQGTIKKNERRAGVWEKEKQSGTGGRSGAPSGLGWG